MASDEQFSLCWNNFHANMSQGFHGLLSRGDLVDVTLAAEGRLLQAHKLVLSVCSPYFQEMFKMNPTQHPIVFLKDVSHSALRDLLQFMYQGEVNVKQEELASFISTAEQLQVKGLTGNQNDDTPSKPKPARPGPRSQQRPKLETDIDTKPSSTPVAVKRPNRPSIASNNSSSSQSGPAKRKCVDPLEAGPSGSTKEEFVTIPDEEDNSAVAPKMEPEFVNESMWDDDDDGANNDDTNFGEDDSNMDMTGFDGSATGDTSLTAGGEGGAVGDAQASRSGRCRTRRPLTGAEKMRRYREKLKQNPEEYFLHLKRRRERSRERKLLKRERSEAEREGSGRSFIRIPLTGAEKTRRHREKLKQNPEEYFLHLKKRRERSRELKLLQAERSEAEREIMRKQWREEKRERSIKGKRDDKLSKIQTLTRKNANMYTPKVALNNDNLPVVTKTQKIKRGRPKDESKMNPIVKTNVNDPLKPVRIIERPMKVLASSDIVFASCDIDQDESSFEDIEILDEEFIETEEYWNTLQE